MSGATRKPGFTVAVLATLLAAVVVLLGAYTRLTHAGLGCRTGQAATASSTCR